jgi:hypothetical protein
MRIKNRIFFVPLLLTVLAGCVATMPDTPIAQDERVQTASKPPVMVEKSFTPKIELPEGTVDGAKFMKEFRPELYLPNQQASNLFQTLVVNNIQAANFTNSLEKAAAVKTAKETPYVIDVEQKALPKYLVYRVAYVVSPNSVNPNTGHFYIKPNYSAKIPGLTFGHSDRVPCGSVQNCFQSYISYGLPDNGFEIASYPYKSSKNARNISQMELAVLVLPGFKTIKNVDLGRFKYEEQNSSNLYVLMTTSLDEVRDILKSGFSYGNGSRAYTGYSLVKVNDVGCKVDDKSTKHVRCTIDTTPVKYTVENFMGKPQFEMTPVEFRLSTSKLEAPLR